uniref:2'-5' RNA ligase family protein n=1 Tax=Tetraselmis sp. GSL018 TaxID=582737 RepID=A0A061SB68_9CHLO
MDLPLFHRDPQPHVSLAWAPGDRAAELREAAARLTAVAPRSPLWRAPVHSVSCIVGERVYTVWPPGERR